MNLFSILIKLWPAIKDTLLGGFNFSFYLKRNRAIAMLIIASCNNFRLFFSCMSKLLCMGQFHVVYRRGSYIKEKLVNRNLMWVLYEIWLDFKQWTITHWGLGLLR